MSLQPRVAQHLPLLRGEGLFWSLLLPASLHRQVRLRTDLVSKAVSSSPHSRSLAFSFVVFLKQLLTSLLQMWDHKAGKMSYIFGPQEKLHLFQVCWLPTPLWNALPNLAAGQLGTTPSSPSLTAPATFQSHLNKV